MKALDLAKLALKMFRGARAALPALGFAICAFCLCFAGAIWASVQQEKSQPCELTVSTPRNSALSDKTLAALAGIPGVTKVSPLLEVPVSIAAGKYTAQLTLTGIYADYLDGAMKTGGVFPEGGSMPYIVLNEAACRQFSNSTEDMDAEEPGAGEALPGIDWLNASFTVQAGGARRIVSKVCGILASAEGEEPGAYISLAAAKELLRAGGQSAAYAKAKARVENIGYASATSRAAAALGLATQGADEALQKRWDAEAGEMGYLLAVGLFALLSACVLTHMGKRMSLMERREAWGMLRWLGMRERSVGALFALQGLFVSLAGAAAGVIAALALPSFLQGDQAGVIFMLQIPLWAVSASSAVCLAAGFLSMVGARKGMRYA